MHNQDVQLNQMGQHKNHLEPRYLPELYTPALEAIAGGELALSTRPQVEDIQLHPIKAFGEHVYNLPAMYAARHVAHKAKEVGRAVKTDYQETDNKFRAVANICGIIAVKAAGSGQLPILFSLSTAAKLQKETGIPVSPGVVAGIMYGSSCYVSARVLNSGVNLLPNTCEATNSSLNNTDKLSSVLPGLTPAAEQKVSTRGYRALASYSPGIMCYILAAGVQNQSQPERRELCKNIGRDATAFFGATAIAASGIIFGIQQKNPKLAERILDGADNPGLLFKILVGVAGVTFAADWSLKKIKKQIANRHQKVIPVPVT